MSTPRKKTALTRHRYGGRATAGGVGYEVRVATLLATKMLAGARCAVWNGIGGADISAITMQVAEPVDDVLVTLCSKPEASVYISAKTRASTIPLTAKSPAFSETVDAFVRQFLKLQPAVRANNRLLWAVPSSGGRSATRDLPMVLDCHRDDDSAKLSAFLRGRQTRQREAIDSLVAQTKRAWKKHASKSPSDAELREFLRLVHVEVYDFEVDQRHDRQRKPTSAITLQPNHHMRSVSGNNWRAFSIELTNMACASPHLRCAVCSLRMG